MKYIILLVDFQAIDLPVCFSVGLWIGANILFAGSPFGGVVLVTACLFPKCRLIRPVSTEVSIEYDLMLFESRFNDACSGIGERDR